MSTNTRASLIPVRVRGLAMTTVLLLLAATRPAAADDTRRATPERIDLAIQSGLRYILSRQVADGSFACEKYPVAVTGLAGLALMANLGDQPAPAHDQAVRGSLNYLLAMQGDNGMSGVNLYEHSIAALAVLHRFGMGGADEDPRLVAYAAKAVALTLEAAAVSKLPRARGGWAYTAGDTGSDLSNTAWQVMMLFSARQCGFQIPPEVLRAALDYVNRCAQREGYGYTPAFTAASGRSYRSLTGAAVFLKEILQPGAMQHEPGVVQWLTDVPPSWGGGQYRGYFYCAGFYTTQGVFQIGGRLWRDYFDKLAVVLLERQESDGHWPFPPDNQDEARKAGTVYSTAIAVLMLSLEKQQLPIYQRQAFIHFTEE